LGHHSIGIASDHLETIKGLIANGVGISFLLKEIVEDNDKIAIIPLNIDIAIKIALVWKKGHYLSNVSKAFMNLLNTNPITDSDV